LATRPVGGRQEYELHVLKPTDDVQLKIRRRIPLEKIVSLLLEGHEVFIECDRRIAHYIRKRASSKIGIEVEAYPSVYKGMEGYVFKVSLVDQVIKMRGVAVERPADRPK
jgi:hypothetical protein